MPPAIALLVLYAAGSSSAARFSARPTVCRLVDIVLKGKAERFETSQRGVEEERGERGGSLLQHVDSPDE